MRFHAVLASLAACVLSSAALSQAADGFLTRSGNARADLQLPKALLDQAKAKTGHQGRNLGYTYEEMLGYPVFEHRLRTVENLFRDVMHPAEFGGLIGDNLLAESGSTAQIAYLLYSQLDAKAGRQWEVPSKPDDWGVKWIPRGTGPTRALEAALCSPDPARHLPDEKIKALQSAGPEVVRLLARLVIGAQVAAPFLMSSMPGQPGSPGRIFGDAPTSRRALYDFLVSPYLGDVNDDTIIVADRSAYDAMRFWDRNYSAFGTALFLRHFDAALAEFKTAKPRPSWKDLPTTSLECPLGIIRLSGSKPDHHKDGGLITLDLGGNDTYSCSIGAPSGIQNDVISLVLDLSGNDSYDGTGQDGNVGCGMLGLGMVADLSGDDRYQVSNGGMGFGLYGTGILADAQGNDVYECGKGWGQGAAYAGVGLLLDREGNDSYKTICMSMGFGGTLGVGALVDVMGDDHYFTADTGNHSMAWGKTVSMCLGSGYGRRCDSGDGQNQGGGFGIVVEGGGDDHYHTSIFSLGSGYWWGAGIFEERGGDDTYRFTHYCLGSGAHFAVGSFVDLAGNDSYNDRPDAVERWGGLGRDGSVAVCIDAEGNDVWGNLTGGHSDLNSISLFWDRRGDDIYKRMQPFEPGMIGNRPFGSAVPYPPMRSFRDRLLSAGIFLDTGGKDTYPEGMTAAENSEWQLQSGPMVWGWGKDQDLFP